MAQQDINLGTTANDGTGDTPRDAGTKINENFTELYAGVAGAYKPGGTDVAVADGGTGASSASAARNNLGLAIGSDVQAYNVGLTAMTPVFNFTAAGEARFYAPVAMTLTQQGTSGTGSVAYEKSTAAAPSTFSSTTSPVTLEAGAWLKVTASSVTTIFAVALKRTA